MKASLFLAFILFGIAFCAPADQLITSLPGVPGGVSSLGFNMYSGYVNINEEHNTNYFYWFVESQRDPANVCIDIISLILWIFI